MQTAKTQPQQTIFYYLWIANYMYRPIESNDSTADYYNTTDANDEHFLYFLDRSYKNGIPLNGREALEDLISLFVNRQISIHGLSTVKEQYEKWLNHTLLLTKGTLELSDVSDWCRNYDIDNACNDLRLEFIESSQNVIIEDIPNSISEVDSFDNQADVNSKISTKVQTVVILELLKQMNKGKAKNDLSKICRLIEILTGKSYNKIYNDAQKGIVLSNYHDKEILKINKLLELLSIDITIKKDVDY